MSGTQGYSRVVARVMEFLEEGSYWWTALRLSTLQATGYRLEEGSHSFGGLRYACPPYRLQTGRGFTFIWWTALRLSTLQAWRRSRSRVDKRSAVHQSVACQIPPTQEEGNRPLSDHPRRLIPGGAYFFANGPHPSSNRGDRNHCRNPLDTRAVPATPAIWPWPMEEEKGHCLGRNRRWGASTR